jgi:hypothetical protein
VRRFRDVEVDGVPAALAQRVGERTQLVVVEILGEDLHDAGDQVVQFPRTGQRHDEAGAVVGGGLPGSRLDRQLGGREGHSVCAQAADEGGDDVGCPLREGVDRQRIEPVRGLVAAGLAERVGHHGGAGTVHRAAVLVQDVLHRLGEFANEQAADDVDDAVRQLRRGRDSGVQQRPDAVLRAGGLRQQDDPLRDPFRRPARLADQEHLGGGRGVYLRQHLEDPVGVADVAVGQAGQHRGEVVAAVRVLEPAEGGGDLLRGAVLTDRPQRAPRVVAASGRAQLVDLVRQRRQRARHITEQLLGDVRRDGLCRPALLGRPAVARDHDLGALVADALLRLRPVPRLQLLVDPQVEGVDVEELRTVLDAAVEQPDQFAGERRVRFAGR